MAAPSFIPGAIRPGSGQRTFTRESIEKARKRVQESTANVEATYWKVSNPQGALQLRGAVDYVQRRFPNAQGTDRFVYLQEWRVAGPASAISQALLQAGINTIIDRRLGTQVAVSPQSVLSSSIDPLSPGHAEYIAQLVGQRGPAQRKEPQFALAEYIAIGNQLRQQSGLKPIVSSAEKAQAAAAGGGRGGGKSPQAKLQHIIQEFNNYMNNVINGIETKVWNVTEFNPNTMTQARSVKPTKADIRPQVSYQGRMISVPIIVKANRAAEAVPNFRNFIDTVVRNAGAPYSGLADQILADFNNRVSRPMTSAPSAPLPSFAPTVGTMAFPPTAAPSFAAPVAFPAPTLLPGFGGSAVPQLPGLGAQFQPGVGAQLPPGLGTQLPPGLPSGGAGTPGGGSQTPSGSGSPRFRPVGGLPISGTTGTLPGGFPGAVGGVPQLPSLSRPAATPAFNLPPLPSASPQ